MNILGKRRMLGLLLAPFALFTACVGLSPEEQAEYQKLEAEIARIQVEEIEPRRIELQKIIAGQAVVDVERIQAQIQVVRNQRLAPLNEKLSGLKQDGIVHAAPGTRVELEELHARLRELEALADSIEEQIESHREQMREAKAAVADDLENEIHELRFDLDSLEEQLSDLYHETDLRAIEIEELLSELRARLEELDEDSEDAGAVRAEIEELESEFESIHHQEAERKAELVDAMEEIERQSHALQEEIEDRTGGIVEQFELLIHGLEMSLHDVSEEKADVLRKIEDLELSAPEELEKTIQDLEGAISQIVNHELEPLIKKLDEATTESSGTTALRERLRSELEFWLTRVAELRARMAELTEKSFASMLEGIDLGAFSALK